MHTIQFNPTNESARRAFSQLVCARRIVTAAAYDMGFVPNADLDDRPCDPGSAPGSHDLASMTADRLLRHSLIQQPQLSVLSRDGRVAIHIGQIDESDAIDLHMEVERRFHASTLNRGTWSWALDYRPSSIAPGGSALRYRIGRLVLPIPSGSQDDDRDALSAGATAAATAALLAWQHDSIVPSDAFAAALAAPVAARWISGRTHQREVTADAAVDVQICTGVELEIEADIDGSVFLGRMTGTGNGLLVSTKHR